MALAMSMNKTIEDRVVEDLLTQKVTLERQLRGERLRYKELQNELAETKLRLERTVCKSKGRRRAIKQLEHALLKTRIGEKQ